MAARLKLNLDLIEILKSTTDSSAKRRAFTPILRKSEVKREFGRRAIEKLLERTNAGVDKNGKSFARYSKSYINSPIFSLHGKSRSEVNLKLTEEMQSDIRITKVTDRGVEIGFGAGVQNDKAHGHVHGSNNLPVRDFWGLPKSDLAEIMNSVIRDYAEAQDVEAGVTNIDGSRLDVTFVLDENG